MALDKSILKSGILDLSGGPNYPQDTTEAAQRWASMYSTYAATAVAPAGPTATPVPASLEAAEALLAGNLKVAFEFGNAASAAQAMALAFDAFWMAPPVAFLPAPPALLGAVTASTGAPVLQTLLASLTPYEPDGTTPVSVDGVATKVSDALDTFTKLVIVTSPLPPPAPPIIGPIS